MSAQREVISALWTKSLSIPEISKCPDRLQMSTKFGDQDGIFGLWGWRVRGLNPGGGEIFRTRPDGLRGSSHLLYNQYRVSSYGTKRPRGRVAHPPPASAEVVSG
jgi:hypothetical protein